jgi:ABC-2 type transport system permease protein
MSTPAPIADLTYRGYDGELESPRFRWWVIARMSIRLAFKKKGYWWLTGLSGAYYAIMLLIMFFMEQLSESTPQAERAFREFLTRVVWKDQFLHAVSAGQMWFLFLALLLGAGSIANDNRANALLVYLSKPCNKTDYMLGKFMGIWVPLVISMSIPTLFFWIYGALSFRPYQFLSADPWIIVKMAVLIPLSAAFYTSLALFFSSIFKQGRVAGAAMAGLYFLSNFFTQLMAIAWSISQGAGGRHGGEDDFRKVVESIQNLFYASIDGINIGLAKAILGTDGSPYFGLPSPVRSVPAPSLIGVVALVLIVSSFCVWFAWRRIRAVEVVGG